MSTQGPARSFPTHKIHIFCFEFPPYPGPRKVVVDGKVYSGDHVLIAVGGFPTWPDLPGADLGIDSDGFFELDRLPKKAVVVGAGYIAVEMAGILQSLGSQVSLMIRKERVSLPHLDRI